MTTSRVFRVLGLNMLLGSLCLVSILTAAESGTQPAGGAPKIGDRPPLLQAKTLLQAPPGAKLDAESLRGKVVVLEFWGTWCGACVMAIPHMNELAEKLQDQPVQFVAITWETEAKVAPFLSKRPIKGWVALDTDKAMASAYAVQGWPHTVVLGRDGRIAAITSPGALQEQHLRDLVAGKTVSLPVHDPSAGERPGQDPDEKSAIPPLFQLLVRPSTQPGSSSVANQTALTARGYSVREILPTAFDYSSPRILISTTLPEGKYDFVITQPKSATENKNTLLQTALRSAFGLTATHVTKEVDCLVLQVRERNAPGLVVSPSKFGGMNSNRVGMTGVASSVSTIVWGLESLLHTPVVDETELKDKYDFSVRWSKESTGEVDRESLFKALREQLGLELVPAKRPVEMLVIEGVPGSKPVKTAAAPAPTTLPAAQTKAPAATGAIQ